jgi:hypothetical protein
MNNEMLKNGYLEILQKRQNLMSLIHPDLKPKDSEGKNLPFVTGLFLPSVSDNYQSSNYKIMVVGAETAGWYPLVKRNEKGEPVTINGEKAIKDKTKAAQYAFESTAQYVELCMNRHAQVLNQNLNRSKNTRGKTFYNFLRTLNKSLLAVDASYEKGGWIYANLHCFDWNKKSPMKGSIYSSEIKPLSKALLDFQIEVLQPDFILFLNGTTTAGVRREFFPHEGHNQRCFGGNNVPNIADELLWQFELETLNKMRRIPCIRTQHPSSRTQNNALGLNAAIDLLVRMIKDKSELKTATT